jgi:hypothetical protein
METPVAARGDPICLSKEIYGELDLGQQLARLSRI